MEEKKVTSPCISICKKDYSTGYCYGCARTDKEKIIWKDEKTNDDWKKENIILPKDINLFPLFIFVDIKFFNIVDILG